MEKVVFFKCQDVAIICWSWCTFGSKRTKGGNGGWEIYKKIVEERNTFQQQLTLFCPSGSDSQIVPLFCNRFRDFVLPAVPMPESKAPSLSTPRRDEQVKRWISVEANVEGFENCRSRQSGRPAALHRRSCLSPLQHPLQVPACLHLS